MTSSAAVVEEITISDYHSALMKGELTAVELVDWYLARIQAHNRFGAEIQAVVTVNPKARNEAAVHDDFLAATGTFLGPLHGVPVLVKDQAETAGLRTTFGSSIFANYVPKCDATLIRKLKDAGAVILAKSAMCDFGAGWFSTSSMTGHTKNPYCLARESGGSSAGTAAGVAANFGLVGIGEDTGGSIRIPASFNNLFGLRVTTGLISRTGFSPLVHFQDTPGPMARTVSDIARVLDAVVGFDPNDPLTVTAPAASMAGSFTQALEVNVPLTRWRIGVLESGFGSDSNPDCEPVNQVVRAAIRRIEHAGVKTRPGLKIDELSRWITDTSAYTRQARSDITEFLAQRPGAPASSFMEIYQSKERNPLIDLFHSIAEGPVAVDEEEYRRLRRRQEEFRTCILKVFADNAIDFLVYPTVQVIPPTRVELADEKYSSLTFPTNTVIGAQAGLPALTIPVGFTESRLPIGMELLGSPLSEREMLQFAYAWESLTKHRRTPVL